MNPTETKAIINVKAILFPPFAKGYGGRYKPVAHFEGPVDVNQFSSESFFELIKNHVFLIGGVKCQFVSEIDSFDKVGDTITLRGVADSLDDSFVDKIKSKGWVFDEVVLRQYKWRGQAVPA